MDFETMKVAVIYENDTIREIIKILIQDEFNCYVDTYISPAEFLMRGKEYDLVLAGWNFKSVTMDFFLRFMDTKKLILHNVGELKVHCLAVHDGFFQSEKYGHWIRSVLQKKRIKFCD